MGDFNIDFKNKGPGFDRLSEMCHSLNLTHLIKLLDKRKSDHRNQCIAVNHQNIKVVSSVELLGIQIDDKLNFNLHISNIESVECIN